MQEPEIITKLKTLKIRRVIVFDDKVNSFNDQWQNDDSSWLGFCISCQNDLEEDLGLVEFEEIRALTDHKSRAEFLKRMKEKEGTLLEKIREIEAQSGEVLKKWLDTLRGWELKVDEFTHWKKFEEECDTKSAIEILEQYQIVLLDHDFGDFGGSDHSDSIARKVGSVYEKCKLISGDTLPPPILIMFSAMSIQSNEIEKSEFTTKINLIRGCYEFLPKEAIHDQAFSDRFLQVINQAELGRSLHSLGLSVVKAISEEANLKFMENLQLLSPQSIQFISEQRLYEEGVTIQDYFIQLFIGLLQTTFSHSQMISDSTMALLDAMKDIKEPSMTFDHIGLCKVQNRLLFNYEVNKFRQPIALGDIFIFKNGSSESIAILISQSCDLLIRGNVPSEKRPEIWNSPKINRVTLLIGKQVELSKKNEFLTRYFATSIENKADKAIEWNFANPIVLPRVVLDFVTLDETNSGQAVIPLIHTPVNYTSSYWTDAYSAYIDEILKTIQTDLAPIVNQPTSNLSKDSDIYESKSISQNHDSNATVDSLGIHKSKNNSDGLRRKIIYISSNSNQDSNFGKIFIPDDIISDFSPTFGGGAIYDVQKENNLITLPIRRVARLKLTEVLRLQHKFHTTSSRIGVMTDLKQVTDTVKIKIFKSQKSAESIEIPASTIQVDDKYLSLVVNSDILKQHCQDNILYKQLLDIANVCKEFDLMEAVKSSLSTFYDLEKIKGTWTLKPKGN
jgi:hypothetical protein